MKPIHTPRSVYAAPAIVYDARLEAQAGSPLGLPDPLNDLNLPQ